MVGGCVGLAWALVGRVAACKFADEWGWRAGKISMITEPPFSWKFLRKILFQLLWIFWNFVSIKEKKEINLIMAICQ